MRSSWKHLAAPFVITLSLAPSGCKTPASPDTSGGCEPPECHMNPPPPPPPTDDGGCEPPECHMNPPPPPDEVVPEALPTASAADGRGGAAPDEAP